MMGKHYLLNLYGCPFDLLDDHLFIVELLNEAAFESGATVLNCVYHHFEPQGVTAVLLLAESHLSIHTWPEKGKAAVDCYTCGDTEPKVACDIIIERLQAKQHEMTYIAR
jgi:S-adenosylmethionine decarboxylase